jgi:hypothetical protein
MTKKFKYEAPKVMDLTGFSASGQDPLACGFGASPSGGPGGDTCNPGFAAGTTGCAAGYSVDSGSSVCTAGYGVSASTVCSSGGTPTGGCFTGGGQSAPSCSGGSAN